MTGHIYYKTFSVHGIKRNADFALFAPGTDSAHNKRDKQMRKQPGWFIASTSPLSTKDGACCAPMRRGLTYPAGLALANRVARVVGGLVLLARVEGDGVVRRVLVGACVGAAVARSGQFGGAVEDDLKKEQQKAGGGAREDAGSYIIVGDVHRRRSFNSTLMEQFLFETTV